MISRHLDPIINSCCVIKNMICVLQMGVSVPSGCISVQARERGFVPEATELFPLSLRRFQLTQHEALATRSTSGFKQTVVNSG